MNHPGYLKLLETGELETRSGLMKSMLADCVLCPHQCKVNRLKGESGFCKTLDRVVVSGAMPHFGEESELVGRGGSGTIFFSYCNLRCVFCQNYEISCRGEGRETSAAELAVLMMKLQNAGCHNINFVSPSHVVPQMVEAISAAAAKGLRIPIVYNSGGYDLVDTLRLLEGIVDIYMPDFKFFSDAAAEKYLGVKQYGQIAGNAVKEMFRQVGNLDLNEEGIAFKGVMIRHLVLPENLAETSSILEFIAQEISPDTYVNIMEQYYPAHKAAQYKELKRKISPSEYKEALQAAKAAGLRRFVHEA